MAKVADGIRYAERVVAGEIVAGEFVRLACQRFLDDLKYGEERGIYFSEPRAQHILNFYKFVPHVKGALAGQPIELMDWHVFILINIFGFVIPLVNEETREVVMRSDGSGRPVMVRRFRTAYNEVARKNAKSTLSSGIGLYMTGADGEGGAEVYSAATTRDQARIVFEDAKNMVRKARSTLGRLFDFNKLAIYQEQSASKFEPLSSDANNLDGLNIHCAIIDELHAHKTRDVWDVLETATGARLQSLLFGITTAGFNKEGICYEQRDYAIKVLRGYNSDVEGAVKDDSYFAIIYTLDEGDDPFDETVWQKANPGLGICKRWDDLRRLAKKAKEQVSARVNFFTKHMNVWVTAESAWMDMIKWEKCEYIAPQHELKTYPMWVGVDLAHKIDICAAAKLWRTDNGHVHADFKFWLPEGRLERCSRQQAELYRKWAEMDKLILTDGDVIDHAQIKSDLLEWIGGENLRELGFDPWSAMQFSLALAEEGIPLVEVPQTVRNLSEAMKETESLVYAGRFHHSNHPVMNWMMSNVTVKPDKNDNIFPNKSTPEAKIDGPVAMFTAMSRMLVNGGEGNTNISGVTVVFRAGEQEQTPPEGFESSGSETVLGTEVKYDTPITRTITSANIDRLRFTFGVQALVETTSKGDRNPSEVRLLVQIQRNGGWVTEKDITIKGKTTSQYLASVVVGNLPPRPFNIRMRRMTPDSTTDQLQNKTLWSSYTEIIDVKQCYPNTALVGVQVDSEQFGSQQVSRNYHLRGRILQVPSNYNPQTRQYSGIWDGTFRPAYSDNMAWCLWDMLIHPRYGMGKRLGAADVDKWALYVIGQYCDQSVPNGFGGTEPRITCNAYLTTQRKAWDVLSDFCSAMRCMPVWNGQTLTFVQDRPSDKVWIYNRSNVVMPDDGAPFRYSFSALKDRHNAVEVNWIDPNNGWETATELVEDTQAIARYGRNVTKMDAFGCTSRGQAHRAGLWLIKTELLETQTVDFSVGAEGLRHVPGDVIEICDDDYAGISTGGRVLAVNSQTRTLTLDREITLPSSGTTLISLVDGSGNPVSVEVQSVTDGVKVKVSRVPDGVAEYSVWGLKLPTLRQRLFRCVSIRENDDGTYAITAVQHVPEKEAIVDNGAHFDGDLSGTVNGVTPPAVQHLTAEVTADSGEYQVLARWDTPKVVKGVSFLLRLAVAADDGSERLVSTARTTETTYRFRQLALGNYRLTVRAVNAWGQQGDPASVSFRIAAPAAPSQIELTPGYFQITATPHLAVYDPTVQFEFWFSEKRISDIRQVETTARYLGTALYWIAASINIKPGHDYYFYIRSVNTVGKSAFVEAVGRASDDAEGYLDFFKGQITESHLGKELLEKVELTEDNASKLEEFSKEWKDANDKWNAMWGVKIEQTEDGKHYVAGLGLSMEDTEEGKLSQFLVAANRIAFIDPSNGNTRPMFVGQGDQIFMNDVFLKRLTAPTITSGGNPPAFSLTPDGRLTAKNADISGNVNANSGTLNNVTINENCRVLGKLSANQIEGDLVKTVGKAFPRDSRAPERWPSGTITVRVYDDQPFDRQIVIPAVAFSGAKHEKEHTDIYSSCRLIVRKNGAEIYNRTALDNTLIYSGVIDMPAGHGHMTLEFSVSAWLVNNWYPTASISDLLVVVMKKATAGITIS